MFLGDALHAMAYACPLFACFQVPPELKLYLYDSQAAFLCRGEPVQNRSFSELKMLGKTTKIELHFPVEVDTIRIVEGAVSFIDSCGQASSTPRCAGKPLSSSAPSVPTYCLAAAKSFQVL